MDKVLGFASYAGTWCPFLVRVGKAMVGALVMAWITHGLPVLAAEAASSTVAKPALLKTDVAVIQIEGKDYTIDDLKQLYPAQFHQDIEMKIFESLGGMSQRFFIDSFYRKWAKQAKVAEDSGRQEYLKKHVKVTDQQVAKVLEQMKDDARLKSMSQQERRDAVRASLEQQAKREVEVKLLTDALNQGKMKLMLTEPPSPKLNLTYFKDDYVRYGPDNDDIKPIECVGDSCPLTVVEYAEFQCPYCAQVPPVAKQLLAHYKGKIRWIMRDFPLDFHERAVPTAIAAGCASEQDKFWYMYELLFANQSDLSDGMIVKHAKSLGIYNAKFKDCLAKPDKIKARIDRNYASGIKLGVAGTPGFYLNGRKLMVQMSYASFKQAFDAELKAVATGGDK